MLRKADQDAAWELFPISTRISYFSCHCDQILDKIYLGSWFEDTLCLAGKDSGGYWQLWTQELTYEWIE